MATTTKKPHSKVFEKKETKKMEKKETPFMHTLEKKKGTEKPMKFKCGGKVKGK